MKKITALPIKPVISNTICPITQEELKADTYVILHCSSTTSIGVDIEALKDYVLLEQRKFKTPCCLLCRKEDHFKADLITNNIPWEPYKPEYVTSYEGIKKILENKDCAFAAINLHKVIESERPKACNEIVAYQINHNCLNSSYIDSTNKSLVHILAQEGYYVLIRALVDQKGLDPYKTLKDGTTISNIAKKAAKPDPLLFLKKK